MLIKIKTSKRTNIYNLDNIYCIKPDGMGHIAFHKGQGAFDVAHIADADAFLEALEAAIIKGIKVFEWREGNSD